MAGKTNRPQGRPATSPIERESQIVAKAMDEAERQIDEGTATSQLLTHFLKQGTQREQLELERLRNENLLLEARTQQIANAERMEELYSEAIRWMKTYSGHDPDEEYDVED